MIKEIVLNSKRVPVPVPISTISDLLNWISTALLSGEHVVTRLRVDGRDVDLDLVSVGKYTLPSSPSAKIEIRIDSPIDLTIQTVDALRNLATIIQPGLRPLAVECWGIEAKSTPNDLDHVLADVGLLAELLINAVATIELHQIGVSGLKEFITMVKEFSRAIELARANSDWKGCSKLLLNRLEPALDKLINSSVSIQNDLFQIKANLPGRLSEISKGSQTVKPSENSLRR